MKKLLLLFNSFTLTACSTVGLSSFFEQQKISNMINISNIENSETISMSKAIFSIILEKILDKYTNPNIFRIYSTPELKLITLNDVARAIENKLFILTEGLNFEVQILNEELDEILTDSIKKK